MSKLVELREGVAELVRDGDSVALEGFTHLIPFAAGHEILAPLASELRRRGGYGVAAICIGVEQGLAVVLRA